MKRVVIVEYRKNVMRTAYKSVVTITDLFFAGSVSSCQGGFESVFLGDVHALEALLFNIYVP